MAGALCSGFFFAIQDFCGACYPLVADTPCARGYLPSADTPRIFLGGGKGLPHAHRFAL